jgi:hypothetical protein
MPNEIRVPVEFVKEFILCDELLNAINAKLSEWVGCSNICTVTLGHGKMFFECLIRTICCDVPDKRSQVISKFLMRKLDNWEQIYRCFSYYSINEAPVNYAEARTLEQRKKFAELLGLFSQKLQEDVELASFGAIQIDRGLIAFNKQMKEIIHSVKCSDIPLLWDPEILSYRN